MAKEKLHYLYKTLNTQVDMIKGRRNAIIVSFISHADTMKALHSEADCRRMLRLGVSVKPNRCKYDEERGRCFDSLIDHIINNGWGSKEQCRKEGDVLKCRTHVVAIWSSSGIENSNGWE